MIRCFIVNSTEVEEQAAAEDMKKKKKMRRETKIISAHDDRVVSHSNKAVNIHAN
jgi:hypothetical protein